MEVSCSRSSLGRFPASVSADEKVLRSAEEHAKTRLFLSAALNNPNRVDTTSVMS